MNISITFRDRLLELIEEQNCSKEQFAMQVGISPNTLSRATVYGIIPNLTSLIKIADFLNVSFDYLLGKTNVDIFYKSQYPTSFHERLLQLTAEKNVKFSQIAHSMPFARNLFHEWIRRKNLPTLENLYCIAEYFNVSADYLLGRTDDKS